MHFIFDSSSTQRTYGVCVGMRFVSQRMNNYRTYTKSKLNKRVPYILINTNWKICCLHMIRLKLSVKIKSITCINSTLPVLPAVVSESLSKTTYKQINFLNSLVLPYVPKTKSKQCCANFGHPVIFFLVRLNAITSNRLCTVKVFHRERECARERQRHRVYKTWGR